MPRQSLCCARKFVESILKPEKRYIFLRKYDVSRCHGIGKKINLDYYFEYPEKARHISFCKKTTITKRNCPFYRKQDLSKYKANAKMQKYINKYISANIVANSHAFAFDTELSRSRKCLNSCGYSDEHISVCDHDFETYNLIKHKNPHSNTYYGDFSEFIDVSKIQLCKKFSAAFIDGMSSIGNYKETNNVIEFIQHLAHPGGCVIGFTFVKRLRSYGSCAAHEITKFKNKILNISGFKVKILEQYEYADRKNIVTIYFYVKQKHQ